MGPACSALSRLLAPESFLFLAGLPAFLRISHLAVFMRTKIARSLSPAASADSSFQSDARDARDTRSALFHVVAIQQSLRCFINVHNPRRIHSPRIGEADFGKAVSGGIRLVSEQ
jgi:hypothetical protein